MSDVVTVVAHVWDSLQPFATAGLGGFAAIYAGLLVHQRNLRIVGLAKLNKALDQDLLEAVNLVMPRRDVALTEFAEESRLRAANLIVKRCDKLMEVTTAYHPYFSELLRLSIATLIRAMKHSATLIAHRSTLGVSAYDDRYYRECGVSISLLLAAIKQSLSYEGTSNVPSKRANRKSPLSKEFRLYRVKHNGVRGKILVYRRGNLRDKGHTWQCHTESKMLSEYRTSAVLSNLCDPCAYDEYGHQPIEMV